MKKSFTLIEVLISVLILSFVFLAMDNILQMLKRTDDTLRSRVENLNEYMIKTLYYDLINAREVNVTSKSRDIDEIDIKTRNSLYEIPEPYVRWKVYKGMLIRIESPVPITSDKEYYTLDNFAKNVKIFKIYRKDEKYLVFVNKKFFEFLKGYDEVKNTEPKLQADRRSGGKR